MRIIIMFEHFFFRSGNKWKKNDHQFLHDISLFRPSHEPSILQPALAAGCIFYLIPKEGMPGQQTEPLLGSVMISLLLALLPEECDETDEIDEMMTLE